MCFYLSTIFHWFYAYIYTVSFIVFMYILRSYNQTLTWYAGRAYFYIGQVAFFNSIHHIPFQRMTFLLFFNHTTTCPRRRFPLATRSTSNGEKLASRTFASFSKRWMDKAPSVLSFNGCHQTRVASSSLLLHSYGKSYNGRDSSKSTHRYYCPAYIHPWQKKIVLSDCPCWKINMV